VDVADQLAAIQAGSASSWPANRRQLHAEHGLKPRGLKAEVQATSTREQRHDAPLAQSHAHVCFSIVGLPLREGSSPVSLRGSAAALPGVNSKFDPNERFCC